MRIKIVVYGETRFRCLRIELTHCGLIAHCMVGIERAHGYVPDIRASGDMGQVPLVEAVRAVVEPLRVGHKVVNTFTLVHFVELCVDLSYIGPAGSGNTALSLEQLCISGV